MISNRISELFVVRQFDEFQPRFVFVKFRTTAVDRIHRHSSQAGGKPAHLVDALSRRHAPQSLELNRRSFLGRVGRVWVRWHHFILPDVLAETEYLDGRPVSVFLGEPARIWLFSLFLSIASPGRSLMSLQKLGQQLPLQLRATQKNASFGATHHL